MEPVLLQQDYIFVIDTNKESFNFYRELCAYCTGFIHESVQDTFFSDFFSEEVEDANCFVDYVMDRVDDEGFMSPSCVWLNKRYGCNEAGLFAILDETNFETFSFPAPLSVGIFFEKSPEQNQIDLIKSRARQFFEKVWKDKEDVCIEGFRLITHTKYGDEKSLD